ncbi:hypothetical protein ALP53_200039 [Pseudomonas savastanoi pv. phaseolicola]|uniref:hypothetical protein n=1 Tax=Pseudomonas savastanoi TaxID=29438 RepID=UPI000F3E388B|nr:hypothetical protein [Pseudomonas savastanoi]RMT02620.1 hypothetical protein ALP53_200039 [Pseudomonas savastanoi pv. phaseolicola]
MRFLIFIVSSFLFLVSSYSYAETRAYGLGAGFPYSTAFSACQAFIDSRGGDITSRSVGGVSFIGYQNGFPAYQCSGTVTYSDGGTGYPGTVVSSSGESCPTGTEYSESKGSCDSLPENKCSSSKGNKTSNYSWHQDTADLPAPKIDIDGCSATTGEISSCLPVSTGGYTCVGDITVTGDLYTPPPATTEPTTPINPTTPSPTPGASGGNSGGGSGSNGSETGTGSNTGTGTGSGTGTGTGSNSGTGTGGGTGTGTGSGSSGGSGGTGTGSGTGTGTGTGTGSNSGTGTGSGSGSSPGTGTGDSGTCEKDCDENGPSTTSLKPPQQGSLDGEGDKWDEKIDQSKSEIKKGLDDLKSIFSPIGDISLGSSGGSLYCPPSVTVLGRSISFCLTQYADSLSWISSAVMALSSVVALLIVFG